MIDMISSINALTKKEGLNGVESSTGSFSSLIGNAVSATATGGIGQTFASVLGQMTTETINSVKAGEAASFAGIQGKANTREVVDAVLQADQSLQTAVAIRDKLVSAYLDVVKMQI
jgi:flagellar hook-basal body complex protein FliE